MTIPPCTTGTHSAVDDTPAPEPKPTQDVPDVRSVEKAEQAIPPPQARLPVQSSGQTTPKPPASPAPPEDESDDPDTAVPASATCKRRGCGATYKGGNREEEQCVHHPGQALFHEGSKGWTCCKRRVLEFDEFLKIPGCKTRARHCFVGKPKTGEEVLSAVRSDFYQTPSSVMASLYLKKIDKASSTVVFSDANTVELDLRTSDAKRYTTSLPTFAPIEPEKCSFKVLGTKLELVLVKADGTSWPVLRSDEKHTGEIIQMGRAGRV